MTHAMPATAQLTSAVHTEQTPMVTDAKPRPAPLLPSDKLLGHLADLQRDPVAAFTRAHSEVGDIARMRVGPQQLVTVARPEYVQQVLVGHQNRYSKETRGYIKMRLILGDGLVTSEGDFWKRQRRIANPAFRRKAVAGFGQSMAEAALATADRWAAAAQTGEPIDVAKEMMRLTLRIAGETLFSMDLTGDAEEMGEAVSSMLEAFSVLTTAPGPYPELWPTPTARRFRKGLRTLDRIVGEIIAERRSSGEVKHDLLGMFMDAQDVETGERMTDRQLRDEVMTMILAGHETTANALAWTFYLLSENPEIAADVRTEIDANLGDAMPTMAAMQSLPLTMRVLQESMRLYPPVWMLSRRAEQDDVIGGYLVKKGSFVYMPVTVMHRHPDLWEQPDKFDPDRFTDERVAARKASGVHKFAYLPFSGGQRKCIGDHFAKMELVVCLAVLLRRFEARLVEGHPVVPEGSITLRPKHGLKMHVAARG